MQKEKIVIAADHAGFSMKEKIKILLDEKGFEVIDEGTHTPESCDYPDIIARAAQRVSSGELKRGIVICGSGIGASIVANKFPNIRAALATSPFFAKLSREHNDSNMLVLPGRFMSAWDAKSAVKNWLDTAFSEGENHKRRIQKIKDLEKKLKLVLLFCAVLLVASLHAKTIEWSGPRLFDLLRQDVQYSKQNQTVSLNIAYNLPAGDDDTDLLLDFDKVNASEDLTGNYKIKSANIFNNKPVMFRSSPSAGFILPGNKIIIAAGPKNFLNNTTDLESFSISFWIYPVANTAGTRSIIEKGISKENKFFGLKVFLADRRVNFRFSNMFFDNKNKPFTLEVRADETAVLNEWHNYCLSFDNTTGKLILSIDGSESAVMYATTSRQADAEVLIPKFSGQSDLVLGGQPFGYLDDLLITRNFLDTAPFATVHKENQGSAMTEIVENDFFNSKITSILINNKSIEPGFRTQIRTSQEWFEPDALKPDWHDYTGLAEGKYFQIKLILMSDVSLRTSPTLRSLKIITADMNDIEPPSLITLTATNMELRIEWNKLFDKRLRGYFVILSDTSGQIEKVDAGDVHNYTFTTLKDDNDYFIEIIAYDKSNPPNESKPSKEKKIHFKYGRDQNGNE